MLIACKQVIAQTTVLEAQDESESSDDGEKEFYLFIFNFPLH
jgi:hypothetical protein